MNLLIVDFMGLKGQVGIVIGVCVDESLICCWVMICKVVDNFIGNDISGCVNIKLVRLIYDWDMVDVFKLIYDVKFWYFVIYDK